MERGDSEHYEMIHSCSHLWREERNPDGGRDAGILQLQEKSALYVNGWNFTN